MKKIYFLQLLIIFGFTISVNSQIIFQEDFQTTTDGTFPAGWTLFNVDGRTPNSNIATVITDAWASGNSTETLTLNRVAVSGSWYTPTGASDDWMMTPAITLNNNNNILIWEGVARDPDFRDGYEVRLSTTTATISASTIILFSVAEENDVITSRQVDLSAYNGQTVYISWRNNSNDKYILEIDNIKVGNPTTLSVNNNTFEVDTISLYPNPAKNNLKVLNNSQQSLIGATIYDISGRNVASYNLNNNLENDLDISKLSSGNYIVIIKSENGQVSKKLIIN